MISFCSGRWTAGGNGRRGHRRGVLLAGRRDADAPGDCVQPRRACAVADIPRGANRRVRDQGQTGHPRMPGGARADRVLPVQRRPGGGRHGARDDRLRGPADRRPQRGDHGEHHQKPRRGVFWQAQLSVPVRGVDLARRDRQQTGQRDRSM